MTEAQIKAYKRRLYYAANKEKCLKAINTWIAKNPNYRKDYYQRNKERIKAYNREQYRLKQDLLAKAKALLASHA